MVFQEFNLFNHLTALNNVGSVTWGFWPFGNPPPAWLALDPAALFGAKDKVISGMHRSLDAVAFVHVLKLDGWRLVPDLQDIICMLGLK